MIKVGVFGASGYTGLELMRLLLIHPEVEVRFATSETYSGRDLCSISPGGPTFPLLSPSDVSPEDVDLVFLCLPHGASATVASTALQAGARVIDLSADFRLKEPALYTEWYQSPHPAPSLLNEAVYGLTETVRGDLAGARLVANPGCYPTSVLLPLQPLILEGLITDTVIVDAKSGVSGAGRKPSLATHFVEVADNLKPYAIGRAHRHLPEMEQVLRWWSEQPPRLLFSPHLLPVPRGLLSTIYAPLQDGSSEQSIRDLYEQCYADEPFIRLLPPGEPATLAHANHSNLCVIGFTLVGETLIITSAIDNLLKGASGQAVQNMNVVFGFDETTGLA